MKFYLVTSEKLPEPRHLQKELLKRGFTIRFLLSYYYLKNIHLGEWMTSLFSPPYPEVFLDSGAYSAMTQKSFIDLKAYARYIQSHKDFITLYANLDVIKDAKRTLENQKILEEEYGLHPLPVFHISEEWNYLDYYLEHYKYIGLGIAGNTAAKYTPWLFHCFKKAKKQTKFHGFGITAWEVMKKFPWHSVDSTAWIEGRKFHHASLFDERKGGFEEVYFGNPLSCYQNAFLLREMGLDPIDFIDHKRLQVSKINQLGAISYYNAAQWVKRRYQIGDYVTKQERIP